MEFEKKFNRLNQYLKNMQTKINKLLTVCLILINSILSVENIIAQETALSKLIDRVDELKKISNDKQLQIRNLTTSVDVLTTKNKNLSRNNASLRKEIEQKTIKILELNGQLSDLSFEYDKLIIEMNRLIDSNKEYMSILDKIRVEKESLSDSLAMLDKNLQTLSMSLREKQFEAELLNAKNKALERRIDELVNYKAKVISSEIFGSFPYAGGLSLTYGKISKGGNLMYGMKSGITLYQERSGENISTTYGSRLLSIGGILKFALDKKNKLGFSYVSTEFSEDKPYKWFGLIEGNIGIPIFNKNIPTNYNRPGFGGLVGVGTIFDYNENVKPYLMLGLRLQELSRKSEDITQQDFLIGFNISAGVYFDK
jgi:hypothetical protein